MKLITFQQLINGSFANLQNVLYVIYRNDGTKIDGNADIIKTGGATMTVIILVLIASAAVIIFMRKRKKEI